MSLGTPKNFSETLCFLDGILTKTELSITKSFLWFYKEKIMNQHQKTFPETKTIAKMAKCSTRSVNRYIKKYEGVLITHVNHKFSSNQYEFNEIFFEYVMLLDLAGLLKNWSKKRKLEVLKWHIDDDWFLHKILEKNGVIDRQMSHEWMKKCRTIKSYLLLGDYKYKVLQGAASMNKSQEMRQAHQNTASGILKDLRLSSYEQRKLENMFGVIHLKNAREAFLYVDAERHLVKHPEKFIFSKARESCLKMMQIKH